MAERFHQCLPPAAAMSSSLPPPLPGAVRRDAVTTAGQGRRHAAVC